MFGGDRVGDLGGGVEVAEFVIARSCLGRHSTRCRAYALYRCYIWVREEAEGESSMESRRVTL